MALGEYILGIVWTALLHLITDLTLQICCYKSWTDIIDNARKLCNVYDTQRILFRVRIASTADLLHPSPPKDRIAWLQSKNSSAIKEWPSYSEVQTCIYHLYIRHIPNHPLSQFEWRNQILRFNPRHLSRSCLKPIPASTPGGVSA